MHGTPASDKEYMANAPLAQFMENVIGQLDQWPAITQFSGLSYQPQWSQLTQIAKHKVTKEFPQSSKE